ncbi:hypothetical protein QO010_004532 [Caulobacter ginsengisoli]|uniref:Uncharacterized protein n=1 Tax=Caulobacter ginsengisoli TaxID=400775 RepID=A0ABU0IXJ2_9CAUL|nr:hypothetical protein [Caulobacter ginsengisoli]MDQ0466736.1 hypothetical protein [Caulobacter ginsengisoli]
MLLDAADYAVIAPLSTSRLHALAFLADVLSPIYDLSTLSGRILKRRIGPYFPELQWQLDRLVGQGLVDVVQLQPVVEASRAYLDASFCLRRSATQSILNAVYQLPEFLALRDFFRELADALGAVPDDDLDATTQADVTWDTGHAGTIIDYGEWRARNYSRMSADRIEELANDTLGKAGVTLSPGAKVNLYVRYLRRAANG